MLIRSASIEDCRSIAELALIAGDGIPGYFWTDYQEPEMTIEEAGARKLAQTDHDFSYLNVTVAEIDCKVAGMLYAHPLPGPEAAENLQDLPKFIRPMVELEQVVPGSYYIGMLAAYPQYRNRGIGTTLMADVDSTARACGCNLVSIIVFSSNSGALRLYKRLEFKEQARREVIPHPCHPHTQGNLLLLTRRVN